MIGDLALYCMVGLLAAIVGSFLLAMLLAARPSWLSWWSA